MSGRALPSQAWPQLRAVPLLASLPDARLRVLWDASLARDYAAGEVVKMAGAPADRLLLLLRGRVCASTVTSHGRMLRLGAWRAPCALDKIAVLDGRGHTATLHTQEPSSVRSVSRGQFLDLVDDAASVRTHVFAILGDQVRRQHQMRATITLPAEARVATWLLDTATMGANPTSVALPGSQHALAELLDLSRVTVNRALNRLQREGLITVGRQSIAILAPELLALRARDVSPAPHDGVWCLRSSDGGRCRR
jgi:CRP/FNR family transcriptional regulator